MRNSCIQETSIIKNCMKQTAMQDSKLPCMVHLSFKKLLV